MSNKLNKISEVLECVIFHEKIRRNNRSFRERQFNRPHLLHNNIIGEKLGTDPGDPVCRKDKISGRLVFIEKCQLTLLI